MNDINNFCNNSSDVPILGKVVFWTMYDKRVPSDEFKNALEANNVSDKFYREETEKANFISAVRDTCHEFNADFKKLRDDAELISFAVYNVGNDSEDREILTLDQHTKVVYYKTTKNIICTGNDKFEQLVLFKFEKYKNSLSGNLVRDFIVKTIKDNDASLLRPTGGIYFVPSYKIDIVDKLQSLMKSCDCGIMYDVRIPDCESERNTTAILAKDDLVGRLAEIVGFIEKSQKENTVESFLANVNDVKELASRYSQLLNGEIQLKEVIDKCKNIETLISDRIYQLRREKEERIKEKENGKTKVESVCEA